MIRETFLLRAMINWLVINSVLVADGNAQCAYRILPTQSIKQHKRMKLLTDALENEELGEFFERKVVICLMKV